MICEDLPPFGRLFKKIFLIVSFAMKKTIFLFFVFAFKIGSFLFYFLTPQYCIGFATHQNESATTF